MWTMLDLGMRPNVVSYNGLLNVCAEACDATRARWWVREMGRCGQKPNKVTFGTMCKLYARKGWAEAVADTMGEFQQAGGVLNEYFFAALISACSRQLPPDMRGVRGAVEGLVARGLNLAKVRPALDRTLGRRAAAQLVQEAKQQAAPRGLAPIEPGPIG